MTARFNTRPSDTPTERSALNRLTCYQCISIRYVLTHQPAIKISENINRTLTTKANLEMQVTHNDKPYR